MDRENKLLRSIIAFLLRRIKEDSIRIPREELYIDSDEILLVSDGDIDSILIERL